LSRQLLLSYNKSLGDGEEEGPICHIVLDLGGGSYFGRI